MLKKVLLIVCIVFVASSCKKELQIGFHTIPYNNDMPTLYDDEGADYFNHINDNNKSRYYIINDYYNMKNSETLHIIPEFKTYQETTEYSCGCAVALMVLNHYGNNDFDEIQIGEKVKVDTSKGTFVEGLVDFFKSLGYTVDYNASTNKVFDGLVAFEEFVIEKIDKKIPIMVDWVDWTGHWQIIIGIDTCNGNNPYDDVLILADPYDVTDHYQDGYYTFPLARFYEMWREGPCAEKQVPYEQPYVIAYKK